MAGIGCGRWKNDLLKRERDGVTKDSINRERAMVISIRRITDEGQISYFLCSQSICCLQTSKPIRGYRRFSG